MKRMGTSTQGRSEHNLSQSRVAKTECNQFSFGERSSRDDNGSVNMNKIDDAIQDLNDRDRRLSLRKTLTPGPDSSKEGHLGLRRQKSDMDKYNIEAGNGDDKNDPFEQHKSEEGGQVLSKNLSEYASIRVSICMEQKLKKIFRGIQNAKDLIEEESDPTKQGFSINEQKGVRQVDVVFFFHGTVGRDKRYELEPQLLDVNQAQLGLVPKNTYIYSYNNLPEKKKNQQELSQKADNGEGGDDNVPTEGDLLWKALGESSPDPKKDERDDKSEDDYERQKMNLIKKIQIK